MDNNEKRHFPRLYYHYLANYCILDEALAQEGLCITENLSRGGLLVELHEYLPEGTVLELTIAMKDRIITAKTRVVHAQPTGRDSYDIGMTFVDISEEDLQQLTLFLDKK